MKTFSRGGAHPREEKITASLSRVRFPAPAKLIVPLAQHLGAPAKAIVKVGQEVKKGELIAEEGGRISANIHSPVSGKIVSIEERLLFTSRPCQHVIIENDGQDLWAPDTNASRDTDPLKRDEIIDIIRMSGIVGMGGATFPTHVKLVSPKPVDILVINGAECEPYLTCDHRLMVEEPDGIIAGVSLLLRATGITRAIIGIESNKPDAAKALENSIKDRRVAGIRVELLKVQYPQGAEKQLIESLVGRKVPPRCLPFEVGVICQNVGTAHAVWQACANRKPLIERSLTISGDAVQKPANLIVPIGTLFSELFESQGLKDNVKRILCGGPMMGIAIPDENQPVTKGTSGILAFTNRIAKKLHACIRCGRCVESCPLGITPAVAAQAIEEAVIDAYDSLYVPDCVECGCCAYVCPANRPLVQIMKRGKDELAARK